eukprot:TRINITY_DN1215_c1_g2_i1.p1 TRINITY_DN1215_c1_g2~~TRINITY_DN1215_c1_g2_i1.p1  ORF type:complete len:2234 (+),score=560.89 TRINITY_DN1215_c1_g2_i1:73-6702(+)
MARSQPRSPVPSREGTAEELFAPAALDASLLSLPSEPPSPASGTVRSFASSISQATTSFAGKVHHGVPAASAAEDITDLRAARPPDAAPSSTPARRTSGRVRRAASGDRSRVRKVSVTDPFSNSHSLQLSRGGAGAPRRPSLQAGKSSPQRPPVPAPAASPVRTGSDRSKLGRGRRHSAGAVPPAEGPPPRRLASAGGGESTPLLRRTPSDDSARAAERRDKQRGSAGSAPVAPTPAAAPSLQTPLAAGQRWRRLSHSLAAAALLKRPGTMVSLRAGAPGGSGLPDAPTRRRSLPARIFNVAEVVERELRDGEELSSVGTSTKSDSTASEAQELSTTNFLRMVDAFTGGVDADVLANAVWMLRYFRGFEARQRRRNRIAMRHLREQEKERMSREDHWQPPRGWREPPAQQRKGKDREAGRSAASEAVAQAWREHVFKAVLGPIEEHLATEATPPVDDAAAKYWQIVGAHKDALRRAGLQVAVSAATAGAVALASAAGVEVYEAFMAEQRRSAALLALAAAGPALAAVSGPLPRKRRVLDLRMPAGLRPAPGDCDELRWDDPEGLGEVCLFPDGEPATALQMRVGGELLPAFTVFTFDPRALAIFVPCPTAAAAAPEQTRPPPRKVALPWEGIRDLLEALRLLCSRLGVDNDLPQELPADLGSAAALERGELEGEDLPVASPRSSSVFFVPGDPLGGVGQYENLYNDARKRNKWFGAVQTARTRSWSPGSPQSAPGTNSPTPAPRRESHRSPSPSPSPARRRGSGVPSPKQRSVFDSLAAQARSKEMLLLKQLFQGLVNGLREAAAELSRTSPTSADCFGPLLSLPSNFTEVAQAQSAARELSEKARLGPSAPQAGAAPKAPTGVGSELAESLAAVLRERINELEELLSQAKSAERKQKQLAAELAREKKVLEKQVHAAAQAIKANKKALQDAQQLRDLLTEAEETAQAVATMKLDTVEWLHQLQRPTPFQRSMAMIAWVLQEYKRYMPAKAVEDAGTPRFRRAPPNGKVGMVFTDIQSSTAIWEAAQEAMQQALGQHNTIMRTCISRANGYEVKTIGDAFMVAFDTAYDACRFALDVQVMLVKETWPRELLRVADCARVEFEDKVVWNGLRVRIGVHFGAADMQTNPITGRADYFGPTVNKAARVEASATGGLVAVTDDVLNALEREKKMAALGEPIVIPYGAVELKGVSGKTVISGLLPKVLAERQQEVGRHKAKGKPPDGHIAMVFTDIQSSTKLWEAAPKGMGIALKMHNEIMRKILTANRGYEIKTIGDAFMIAFQTALEACLFALQVQVALTKETWPKDLLTQAADCAKKHRDGVLIWNGLRVRIGIHCGTAELELNPLTGRADYFGPTVNKASRTESCACGGLVSITEEVRKALDADKLSLLGDPIVMEFGPVSMKGVAGKPNIFGLVPKALEPRRHEMKLQEGKPEPDKSARLKKRASHGHVRGSPRGGGGGFCCDQQGLRAGVATVARVRAALPLGKDGQLCQDEEAKFALTQLMQVVETAADRTDGVIAYSHGGSHTITWNLTKKCPRHFSQGVRFASLLGGMLRSTAAAAGVSAGVAAGHALFGQISTDRRAAPVVCGPCADQAAALCQQAAMERAFCFIADAPQMQDSAADLGSLQPGDKVLVRDDGESPWRTAEVATAAPAEGAPPLISADGCPPREWAHVCGGEHLGQAFPMTPHSPSLASPRGGSWASHSPHGRHGSQTGFRRGSVAGSFGPGPAPRLFSKGDQVQLASVMQRPTYGGSLRTAHDIGVVVAVDPDVGDQPYKVRGPRGDSAWYRVNEVQLACGDQGPVSPMKEKRRRSLRDDSGTHLSRRRSGPASPSRGSQQGSFSQVPSALSRRPQLQRDPSLASVGALESVHSMKSRRSSEGSRSPRETGSVSPASAAPPIAPPLPAPTPGGPGAAPDPASPPAAPSAVPPAGAPTPPDDAAVGLPSPSARPHPSPPPTEPLSPAAPATEKLQQALPAPAALDPASLADAIALKMCGISAQVDAVLDSCQERRRFCSELAQAAVSAAQEEELTRLRAALVACARHAVSAKHAQAWRFGAKLAKVQGSGAPNPPPAQPPPPPSSPGEGGAVVSSRSGRSGASTRTGAAARRRRLPAQHCSTSGYPPAGARPRTPPAWLAGSGKHFAECAASSQTRTRSGLRHTGTPDPGGSREAADLESRIAELGAELRKCEAGMLPAPAWSRARRRIGRGIA